jgi:superfamily II DNA or RNA helicase
MASNVPSSEPQTLATDRQIIYSLNVGNALRGHESPYIELYSRKPKKSGNGFEKLRKLRMTPGQIPQLPDAIDRQLIRSLVGVPTNNYAFYYPRDIETRYPLHHDCQELVKTMTLTGRAVLRSDDGLEDLPALEWDDGPAWEFRLELAADEKGKSYQLRGRLFRGEEIIDMVDPATLLECGLVVIGNRIALLEHFGAYSFISAMRRHDEIIVPVEQLDDLIIELMSFPRLPRIVVPETSGISQAQAPPKPRVKITAPKRSVYESDNSLYAQVHFDYGEIGVPSNHGPAAVFDREKRQIFYRDLAAERQFLQRLQREGFREDKSWNSEPGKLRLPSKQLPGAVRSLTAESWRVEVDGKAYRQPGKLNMSVSSGIDWFELNGSADFEGVKIALPTLLRAIKKGENSVVLDDGTVGMLPEQWLQRCKMLAAIGDVQDEKVQFGRMQVGILDALLAELPQVDVDATFMRVRDQLRSFEGIKPLDPSAGFIGSLRPYQKDGLGWFGFLSAFGLGGCLADDMGLGKTVQVLALLEQRRALRRGEIQPTDASQTVPKAPTLAVVPRSLIFNWHDEATRFAPKLKLLDHASGDRLKTFEHFADYDLILTTYGTLRNDIGAMRDLKFDYVILDEAQAVKNAASESAKAVRLLRADHRLALSGTPVQNHLGELWSLFEFLNPGMLGASRTFASSSATKNIDVETRTVLAGALRPFILRRTKGQVAADLPERVEQTIYCELDAEQRKLYNELKEHYRLALLSTVDKQGLNKSKMQILEALLRLRQVACHPGLLDKTRVGEPSAKLDTLLPRLAEVVEEGHKALVFSQFTSLLSIVRQRLDAKGTVYEYLDGGTRDRQACVERFQNDPDCKLFLISLKAGGLGLNLTAAQYVFLLDPWWNPSVEAQAIDRAHRIGQQKNVFAYRLIAKDTVEEKVLKLQQTKRELAEAIITVDNAVIGNLGREDLELLLS